MVDLRYFVNTEKKRIAYVIILFCEETTKSSYRGVGVGGFRTYIIPTPTPTVTHPHWQPAWFT
jgi:hypothetical protein